MRRQVIIILFVQSFVVSFSQSQTYLKCLFDEGALPCTLQPVGLSPELELESTITFSDPSLEPQLPLSDVTSISTPTTGNNLQCKLPYQLDDSSSNLYFCSRLVQSMNSSSCITTDGTKQECVVGQYVSSKLDPGENQTYFIEVDGTPGPSCLSLYYYITRSNVGEIILRSTDIIGVSGQEIGRVSDTPFNGWHRVRFSFSPNVNNYNIYFDLQRYEHSDQLVFMALDEIVIIDDYCKSDWSETSTDTEQPTQASTQPVSAATTKRIFPVTSEESSLSSKQASSTPILYSTTSVLSSETSQQTTTIKGSVSSSTITGSIITSQQPVIPFFRCDFTQPCFASGQLSITDGSQFNPGTLSATSEPPRAPTSDVTSITKPTDNSQTCKLPYRPPLDNSTDTTSWDLWFCYKNKCPTQTAQTATCASGNYGFTSLDSSETSKTVVDSVSPNVLLRDAVGEQCLRFYYYFTVYDGQDWGQQIQVWIRPDNRSDNQISLVNLTKSAMILNRWEFNATTFNSSFTNYTLAFVFAVNGDNETTGAMLNRTVYFSLDNVELYDYNCKYVDEQQPTPPSPTTTSENGTTKPPRGSHLPLVLGLSLGFGVLLIAFLIGSLIYKFRVKKHSRRRGINDYDKYFPLESSFGKKNNN